MVVKVILPALPMWLWLKLRVFALAVWTKEQVSQNAIRDGFMVLWRCDEWVDNSEWFLVPTTVAATRRWLSCGRYQYHHRILYWLCRSSHNCISPRHQSEVRRMSLNDTVLLNILDKFLKIYFKSFNRPSMHTHYNLSNIFLPLSLFT